MFYYVVLSFIYPHFIHVFSTVGEGEGDTKWQGYVGGRGDGRHRKFQDYQGLRSNLEEALWGKEGAKEMKVTWMEGGHWEKQSGRGPVEGQMVSSSVGG